MRTLAALVTAGALAASAAQAGALLDTLSSPPSGFADPVADLGPLADSFSTGASAVTLGSVSLLLGATPTDGGSVTVSLLSDAGQSPGALIDTLGVIPDAALSSTGTVASVGGAGATLAANTRYWISVSTSDASSAVLSYTNASTGAGASGEVFANANGVFPDSEGPYQIRVLAAPEPAAWSLMILGAGLIGGAMRRRRRLAWA